MNEREIPSREEYVDAVFGEQGYLSSVFAGYTPRAGQVALARAVDRSLAEKTHLLAEGPTGCHAAGQGVLMYDGSIRRVEDVVVGDNLMGPDGPRLVLGLARGTDEMVDVVPVKGTPWRVNRGHILTLVRTDTSEVRDVSLRDYATWSRTQKHLYKLFRAPMAFDSKAIPHTPEDLRTGFALVPTGRREPYYGFTLDGDGRFLLDDFTVTHNTGKSLAYAVPATYHAWQTGRPVVIVTANIALQEQLVAKDLPLVQGMVPWPFTFALMKGRNHYLCEAKRAEREVRKFSGQGSFGYEMSHEEKRQLEAVDVWAQECHDQGPELESGDVSELPFEPLPSIWKLFSVTGEECTKEHCKFKDRCFPNTAMAIARASQVVVTNYHMLFAHLQVFLATGLDLVLPPFETCIMDEAHKAADVAREYFGFKITQESVRRLARRLRKYPHHDQLPHDLEQGAKLFFHAMFALRQHPERYKKKSRLTGDFSPDEHDAWQHLRKALEETGQVFHGVYDTQAEALALAKTANDTSAPDDEDVRDLEHSVGAAEKDQDRCAKILAQLGEAMDPKVNLDNVYFLEEDDKARVTVSSKLVLPSKVLGPLLFGKRARWREWDENGGENGWGGWTVHEGNAITVVATSATLATNGASFGFAAAELGVPSKRLELIAPSPFDWARQCLFIVPAEMPEPQSPEFKDAVARTVERTLLLSGGRALCLFTSKRVMEYTYDAIVATCRRNHILLLKQGDAPRSRLIETFKSNVTSVLLGLESFWAGVDVPGESCSVVIIDRLPFATPDDPVLSVLSDRERDWFFKYSVPRAMIQLKQGFGRLIRSRECRGVVVCLDQRLSTKRYGRDFLRSLPPVPKSTRLEALVEWLNPPPEPAWDAL